jgi:hypothetical protein
VEEFGITGVHMLFVAGACCRCYQYKGYQITAAINTGMSVTFHMSCLLVTWYCVLQVQNEMYLEINTFISPLITTNKSFENWNY